MAAGSHAVRIEGLKEFNRAIRRVDTDLSKVLRKSMNISADVVADWARVRVPRRSGRAQRSVKSQSTPTRARVVGGGARVPYYPWLDFGGKVGRNESVVRPFSTRGRYIYEGFFQNRDRFTEVMARQLHHVAIQAGLDVTRG